jgi:hypothetical protein
VAELQAAQSIGGDLRRLGLEPESANFRAPTSPTWAHLLRALLRVWAAAFLTAGLTQVAVGLASIAVVGGIPPIASMLRRVPFLGGFSQNVAVRIPGTKPDTRPIIAVAHLDTHPTDGEPLARWHRLVAALSGWLVLLAAFQGRPAAWRTFAGPVAAEAIITLTILARRELRVPTSAGDDNTSGLMALIRIAELCNEVPASSDVWVVATGAGTAGGLGMRSFVREHPELRPAWIVEIDALGSGEVVASPIPPLFPNPGTPAALVRSIVAAAHASGDSLSVRRIRRPHSDARAALRQRVGAITLTAGILHPARQRGPDPANAARAARMTHELAVLDV